MKNTSTLKNIFCSLLLFALQIPLCVAKNPLTYRPPTPTEKFEEDLKTAKSKLADGEISLAESILKTAMNNYTNHKQVADTLLIEWHSVMAEVYRNQRKLQQAKTENQIALNLLAKLKSPRWLGRQLAIYNDYALILEDDHDYANAEMIQRLLIKLRESLGVKAGPDLAANYANLGHIKMKKEEWKEAEQSTLKARDLFQSLLPASSLQLGKTELNLAIIARLQKHHDEALNWASEAEKHFPSIQSKYKSIAYCEMAMALLELFRQNRSEGNTAAAQRYCDDAMDKASRASKATIVVQANPQDLQDRDVLYRMEFIRATACLAAIDEQNSRLQHDPKMLLTACKRYIQLAKYLATDDMHKIVTNIQDFQWDPGWSDIKPYLAQGLACFWDIYQRTEDQSFTRIALALAELTKARQITLFQSYRKQADENPEIRPILEPLDSLHHQISELQRSQQNCQDTLKFEQQLEKIHLLETKIDSLNEVMRIEFPAQYARFHDSTFTWPHILRVVETPLPEGEGSLTYFVANDSIFAFFKTNDGIQMRCIPHAGQLHVCVDSFFAQISQSREENPALDSISESLWNQLFPFDLPQTPLRHLLIVPDDFLAPLPFHALYVPKEITRRSEQTYFIECIDISYDFSLVAQAGSASLQQNTVDEVVNICPHEAIHLGAEAEHEAAKMQPPRITNAVDAFSSIGKVVSLYGAAATEKNFLTALLYRNIVVVTSHGLWDGNKVYQDGFIIMGGPDSIATRLFASEIYRSWPVRAPMVVLNACRTSRGRYHTGEGELSFTHALRMIGVPSIIANGWNADENVNEMILADCYKAIAAGHSPAHALRLAQINAIRRPDGSTQNPRNWAALAHYGFDQPLIFPQEATQKSLIASLQTASGALLVLLALGIVMLLLWSGRQTHPTAAESSPIGEAISQGTELKL